MKIHNIEQQSPEWFELRKLKMTASHAQAIGNQGKGLETYIYDLVAQSLSSADPENYTNEHIERGNELEQYAREMYELERDCKVNQIGFIEHDDYSGCSPDGIVPDEGLIEIKCMKDVSHFKLIVNGKKEVDSKYIWQMQMQMLVTGSKWCDFVAYNPNFEKSLVIHRIERDDEKINKIKEGLEIGKERIKELTSKYTKSEDETQTNS